MMETVGPSSGVGVIVGAGDVSGFEDSPEPEAESEPEDEPGFQLSLTAEPTVMFVAAWCPS